MAELADAPDLESGAARRMGSIPFIRTIFLEIIFAKKKNGSISNLPQNFFKFFNIDARIKTRTIRTNIQNSDGGQRINILNPAHQIALAGNSQNDLRAIFFDNLSRQSPAGRHEKNKSELFGKFHQVTDVAFSATLAVIRVARNFMRTTRKLQTMRYDDE